MAISTYITITFLSVMVAPAGTSPRGENGVGLPADAVASLAFEAVFQSGAGAVARQRHGTTVG